MAYYVLLLVAGLLLVQYSDKGPINNQVAGEILFNGGYIPLFGSILSLIETKKMDSILNRQNGLSLLFIIAAIIFCGGNPGDGWLAMFGIPILETAVMYMILKFLFIKEGKELYMERLELTNQLLEDSMVNGVADGYFFNFVKKIGDELSN